MLCEGKKNERAIPFVVFMKRSFACLFVCLFTVVYSKRELKVLHGPGMQCVHLYLGVQNSSLKFTRFSSGWTAWQIQSAWATK